MENLQETTNTDQIDQNLNLLLPEISSGRLKSGFPQHRKNDKIKSHDLIR